MKFLRQLKKNNRREWFQPRKQTFDEAVKAPMIELSGALTAEMIRFAPDYVREPEEAVFRIYRDTRFSNDKTPYKTHIAAVFPRRGMAKLACASFYFSVSPEEIEVAGGIYRPGSDELRIIRTFLAAHHEEFRKLIKGRKLRALMGEFQGEQLTRVPKGFCAEDPAADLVRCKQWLFYTALDPAIATTPKLLPELVQRLRAMLPFLEFLNRPLVASRSGTGPRKAAIPAAELLG